MNLEDLYRLLRGAHVQAQGIVDTITDPLLVLDRDLRVVNASRAFRQTFNVTRDETVGELVYELGGGEWNIPELRRLLEEVIPKASAIVDYEVSADFPSLGPRTMLVSARRLFHPDEPSTTLLLSIEDATEKRREEAERTVMLDELRHRVKNMLAVIQALAAQTQVEGRSAAEYRDVFAGRLNTLVQSVVEFPSKRSDLELLIDKTLDPYSERKESIQLETKEPVLLEPNQVLPVSLIFHELATNSMKYGALSTSQGSVRISWEIQDEADPKLHLHWREIGGPTVAPPTSRGFGMKLINFAAVHDLGGQAELSFEANGLRADIAFPISQSP